jgi:ATP-binding cassette subfamily C protein CydD
MESLRKPSSRAAARWLFCRARGSGGWVALATALGFAGGLLMIAQAALLARIIHGASIDNRGLSDLHPYFLLLLGVICMRAGLGWAREVAGFRAGAQVRETVRMDLASHLMRLGPFHSGRHASGALAGAMLEHVESLHDFFALYLPQLALALVIPAAILVAVFPLSWAAGGLLMGTAPLIPLFMILVGMGVESVSQRHHQALARMSAHFLDVLQGLPTLKLFGRSRAEAGRVARVSREFRQRTMKVMRVAFLSSAVLEFFACLSIALVAVYLGLGYLGYLGFGFYGHALTLENGLFILLLAPDFYLPLRELGTYYHARADAIGAAEEILKVFADQPPAQSGEAPAPRADRAPHIRFENVSLAYDSGRRPALVDTSFELVPGEKVILTGSSGEGKTTILNLLLGFLRPQNGRILVNETPIETFQPQQWHRLLAWIGQQPVLFHGTVRENILLGRPEATPLEVAAAARSARVIDFCRRLPHGLETRVGEHGHGLSRGQAQRVALARAFLKDAPLLFLDEPTASLDPENEKLVLSAIDELSRGRTVLLLTHRLGSAQRADRILVMQQGRVAEQGSYQELMAKGGVFYRLVSPAASRGPHG